MENVYLLYGTPAEAPWEETLIAIYGDMETAQYELEQFRKDKNWTVLSTQCWQVRKKARFDWTPVPTPYSFRES